MKSDLHFSISFRLCPPHRPGAHWLTQGNAYSNRLLGARLPALGYADPPRRGVHRQSANRSSASVYQRVSARPLSRSACSIDA